MVEGEGANERAADFESTPHRSRRSCALLPPERDRSDNRAAPSGPRALPVNRARCARSGKRWNSCRHRWGRRRGAPEYDPSGSESGNIGVDWSAVRFLNKLLAQRANAGTCIEDKRLTEGVVISTHEVLPPNFRFSACGVGVEPRTPRSARAFVAASESHLSTDALLIGLFGFEFESRGVCIAGFGRVIEGFLHVADALPHGAFRASRRDAARSSSRPACG